MTLPSNPPITLQQILTEAGTGGTGYFAQQSVYNLDGHGVPINMLEFLGKSAASLHYLAFTQSTQWTAPASLQGGGISVLVVGGGGGGGTGTHINDANGGGGGGGGGGVVQVVCVPITAGATYTITVGGGGAGAGYCSGEPGGDGCASSAFGLVAYGGGRGLGSYYCVRGGCDGYGHYIPDLFDYVAGSHVIASGGGGSSAGTGIGPFTPGAGGGPQGYPGGYGSSNARSFDTGGGGGGAGGSGGGGGGGGGGVGGNGVAPSLLSAYQGSTYISGGGGGGATGTGGGSGGATGTGGSGGSGSTGAAGVTYGGGGGGGGVNGAGGSGHPGLVLIKGTW